MITNILLGLILGIVISSYIIINKKVTQIKSNTEYILTKLIGINVVNSNNNKLIQQLLYKFNDFVLRCNELNNLFKIKINRITEHFDKAVIDSIKNDSINQINKLNDNFKIVCNEIMNEIKKQAKISSKINSKTKTSKSINKQ